jgi:hypothetical protein
VGDGDPNAVMKAWRGPAEREDGDVGRLMTGADAHACGFEAGMQVPIRIANERAGVLIANTCVDKSLGHHFVSANVPAFHQASNVRRTVPKRNLTGGFAVAQKADGLAIYEEQIRKVEHDSFAVRQYVERLTQLVDILGAEPTADPQHRGRAVGRALYPQHQPG